MKRDVENLTATIGDAGLRRKLEKLFAVEFPEDKAQKFGRRADGVSLDDLKATVVGYELVDTFRLAIRRSPASASPELLAFISAGLDQVSGRGNIRSN